ncbi:ATP-binding cassette domain-containing protein [Alicyclobacillus cycloheptanicus]|nr:ATP-binding cassette domain-containing protein [Alicyclobacillus cycloheptanicus]
MAVRLNRAFAQASVPFPVDVFTPAEFCEAWRTWRAALPAGTPFEAPASAAENGAANRPASAAENGAANRPASAPVNGAAEASAKPAGDAAGSVQASAADPVIDVRELAHVYLANTPLAHPALHDVTLEVGRGEIVAIVGQTGSGKSTLVQHFNALLTPQRGTVVVDGVDLTNPKADVKRVRRTVGLVFQSPEDQVFETLIGDDIAYGPFQFGLPLAEVRERVRQAMAWVGLDFAWRDRPVQALSGGQKRKVAIAGVLALRPQVMVLDEPTAGLDPQAREELLENLRRLRDESGMTLVIVTHQMEEVARLADRVIVMANGTVVLTCDTKTLFADARRLQALHLGLPESVALLRALAEQGEPVDPVQLTRDAAFAALCGLLGAGADGAHAPDPSSGIEVTTDGDS